MTDLLELTEKLCAVPSVSGNEAELADTVEGALRGGAPHLEVTRIGANVIARTNGGAPERVVLGGHIDTVPANGNATPRREGDSVHGLGAADMKGGIAVMLTLATELGPKPRRDVTLVFYDGEEVSDEHNGLRRLFVERPDLVTADLAILLEPTGGWIEAGCQGTIHARATFHGARSHSARPWMGLNAVHKAAPMLARIAAHEAPTVQVDGLDYRESLQVVRIEAGIANNVVPDRCEIVVNRRYAPACSFDDATAQTRAFLSDADEVEIISASPAAPPNLAHPLIADLIGTGKLDVRPKLGWTDVARFTQHGIAAVNYGPGDPELAHTAGEFVERAELDECLRVLASFVA
ncbi:MAG: succinyl-diaminopimelate desuccinylase [Actinomycetota bacterium]|nr:succinyl-diaminopimelate desuccinylase [Actinomycetota bacterium]